MAVRDGGSPGTAQERRTSERRPVRRLVAESRSGQSEDSKLVWSKSTRECAPGFSDEGRRAHPPLATVGNRSRSKWSSRTTGFTVSSFRRCLDLHVESNPRPESYPQTRSWLLPSENPQTPARLPDQNSKWRRTPSVRKGPVARTSTPGRAHQGDADPGEGEPGTAGACARSSPGAAGHGCR